MSDNAAPAPKSFVVGVKVYGEVPYHRNRMFWSTLEEAEKYASNLMSRWTLVQDWKVYPSDEAPNYRWAEGRAARLEASEKGTADATNQEAN